MTKGTQCEEGLYNTAEYRPIALADIQYKYRREKGSAQLGEGGGGGEVCPQLNKEKKEEECTVFRMEERKRGIAAKLITA